MEKLRKSKIFRILLIALVLILTLTTTGYCEVVSDVGDGGSIMSSDLAQGLYKIVADLAGTLQWIIPIVGVAMILWFVFKIVTGDEQDQQRYKKSIVRVLVCVIVALVAVTVINLLASYFGQ